MSEREYKVDEIVETYGNSTFWEDYLTRSGYEYRIIETDGRHVKYQITNVLEPATAYEKVQMLHRILDLVILINEGTVKRSGIGHPTVFYDYSGHVNMLHIMVYSNGWTKDNHADYSYDIDFDDTVLYKANKAYDELLSLYADLFAVKITKDEKIGDNT